MKKYLFVFLSAILVISLLTAIAEKEITVKAETNPSWNSELYGDRIDVDAHLDYLSKDNEYLQQAKVKIVGQASQINFDEVTTAVEETGNNNFTYDGGTKYFLNKELSLKTFTLRSVGTNVEVWVAEDLAFPEGDTRLKQVVNQEQVDKLRDEFDGNIYGKATSFFGTPDVRDGSQALLSSLGVVPEGYYEGSEKIIILVDNIIDEQYLDSSYPFFVAGFFWQTIDAYIDRNIITIDTNSWAERLETTFYSTTIHELQHLIHSDNDPLEESWINEGMSTFAEYLGGYGSDAASINYYLDRPENSLVKWDDYSTASTGPETIADYGQVYLFTLYMSDKFGQDFIRELALNEKQGISSINEVLASRKSKLDFTELYQNFITALVLDSNSTGKGLYKFNSINIRDIPVDNKGTKRGMTVNFEKALFFEKEGVPAWGGDFKILDFKDKIHSISFDGVDFLPIPWQSILDPMGENNTVFWGSEGDEVDNALIFEADLTGVDAATLIFDNLIAIEEQWDFGVVQVSTDGGYTWTSLANENTRSDLVDEGYPKIRENLPGFSGYKDDWTKETFDLSAYAGQKVVISFRYLTDWGSNDSGWFIDNIEIPEIGLNIDGSSMEEFIPLNELLGKYINYTVSFINETVNKKGKIDYKVIIIDPFNVTQEKALSIKKLFGNGKNYMITTYAATEGDRNPIDFSYEVNIKKTKHKKNKTK